MSDTPVGGVSKGVSPPDPAVVLTQSDELAARFGAALNEAIALIPQWEARHSETKAFVQKYTSFSNDVISSTIAAVEANPELANTKKFDVAEARAALQFLNAFRPIIDQVDELRTNLRFTYFARKARVIADALQTYAIANGIGRDPSSASVAAHAANIKRDLRRPRKKEKKTPSTPTTPV
ncbi:MAG: hypothetical protein JO093_05670 [Acidobacteria bacterium]|nr:hypothetical protein [Acidobacteriota bacterium]MBV9068063.1 hypothetical protein [Acidobacteriota bacterium]MBV9185086.1 hypothetical protein [Acidobacteriota bacterium]